MGGEAHGLKTESSINRNKEEERLLNSDLVALSGGVPHLGIIIIVINIKVYIYLSCLSVLVWVLGFCHYILFCKAVSNTVAYTVIGV